MKKRIFMSIAAVVLAGLLIWVFWADKALEITEFSIVDSEIPESFHGFRIVHISDLHNRTFGEDNRKLLHRIRHAQPDIIVLTGDLVDSRNTDVAVAIRFAKEAAQIAPTYFVSGNHESRISGYDAMVQGFTDAGVVVLANKSVALRRDGDEITLTGVDDPAFMTGYLVGDESEVIAQYLADLSADGYQILLSHRPEFLSVYEACGMDLVLSGHAHGGQFRLPFIGGLVAPGQGFFPAYDAGLFTENDTAMVVSRGLGNSIIPLRFNNRPEIVVITLEST